MLENIVSIINTVEKHMWEYWRVPILHIFLCWTSQHCSHIFSSIFLRSVCVILWCSNNSWKSNPRNAVSQYISLENNVSTVLSCYHMFSADSAAVRLWQLILTFTTPHHPGCCNARNCQNPNLTSTKRLGLTWKWLCKPHPPPPTQTFQALLDELESWNLAQTLTRPIWLR